MTEDIVIDSFARAVFVSWYSAEIEEAGLLGAFGPGIGGDWMDVAPATPVDAREFALRCIGAIEQANKSTLLVLLNNAWKADGMSPADLPADKVNEYAADFGHYLGMMTLGHGVSWFDDHQDFELEVPDREFDFDLNMLQGTPVMNAPGAEFGP